MISANIRGLSRSIGSGESKKRFDSKMPDSLILSRRLRFDAPSRSSSRLGLSLISALYVYVFGPVTQEIFAEVKSTLEDNEKYKLIIRKGKNWPLGILGVVAGKVAEEYHCPTFILRENNEILEGSGRSIDVFNLIEAVSSLSGQLEKYGGHSQAMGIKIKPKNLPQFKKICSKLSKKAMMKIPGGKGFKLTRKYGLKKLTGTFFRKSENLSLSAKATASPYF